MDSSYNKEKILECLFDPEVSEILAELEDGGKEPTYLSEKLNITEAKIDERLSYLIEHDFVKEEKSNDKTIFSVNSEKLAEVVEQDKNFEGVVDGLTEMDSFLN